MADAVVVTSLRAINDKYDPPTILASTIKPTKKETTMSGYTPNYTGVSEVVPAPKTRFVPGIGGSNSIDRILATLHALGLCPPDMLSPLKTLVCNGDPMGKWLKVTVAQLDAALSTTDASVSQRMAFKSALTQIGLLA
jgi:hypothetical protein